jgi:hypothetical protein
MAVTTGETSVPVMIHHLKKPSEGKRPYLQTQQGELSKIFLKNAVSYPTYTRNEIPAFQI